MLFRSPLLRFGEIFNLDAERAGVGRCRLAVATSGRVGAALQQPRAVRPDEAEDLPLAHVEGLTILVTNHRHIVWCCLPRFDGDPVFNALLQRGTNTAAGGDGKAATAYSSAFGIEIESKCYETNDK